MPITFNPRPTTFVLNPMFSAGLNGIAYASIINGSVTITKL